MDASALENAISTSERSLDSLEVWLVVVTVAVVIGLAIEYGPDIKSLLTDWPLDKKKLFEMVGASIVLLAIAGEVRILVRQSHLGTELRNANHQYIAMLNQRSEELRKRNLDFEAAISPRILEQGLTAAALSKFAGVSALIISPSDFEPKRAAGQIRFMLSSAGWKIARNLTPEERFAFFDGVVVHVGSPRFSIIRTPAGERRIQEELARRREAANSLIEILNKNGIVARSGYPVLDPVIVVVVGPKPLPATLQLKPEDVPTDARGNRVWGNIEE